MTPSPPSLENTKTSAQAIWSLVFGILIVGLIVYAVVLPVFNSARVDAMMSTESQRIKGAFTGCLLYASDHDGRFPESLAVLAESGVLEAEAIESTLAPGSTFLYRPGLTSQASPNEVILAAPVAPHGLRAVGHVGGSIKAITEERFQSDYARFLP